MINLRIFLVYGIIKVNQLNINSASQILQKELGELISEVELTLQEPPDIGSPLAFLVNEIMSFQNTCIVFLEK